MFPSKFPVAFGVSGLSLFSAPVVKPLIHRKSSGHLMPDHMHRLLSVPPKYSGSNVMGFIKGKSAIHIARVYAGRRRNFVGQHFWARGYWVSTVGKNEAAVRQYIQDQEKEDKRLEQLEPRAL
jgi:putative transposase